MQAQNYRLGLEDQETWLKHLQEHGFVVLKEVVNKEEV